MASSYYVSSPHPPGSPCNPENPSLVCRRRRITSAQRSYSVAGHGRAAFSAASSLYKVPCGVVAAGTGASGPLNTRAADIEVS